MATARPGNVQPPTGSQPSARILGAGFRRGAHAAVRGARTILVSLTRPLPDHVADYRDPARSALVIATLGVVGLTYPLSADAFDRTRLAVLAALGLAFGAASLVPRLHPLLARADGLLGVTLIAGLVTASGGSTSIYRPLLVLLLLYAAMFYDTGRLTVTGILIGGFLVVPPALGGMDPTAVAVLVVEMPIWALLAAAVHGLVQRTRATARTDGLTGLSNHITFQSMLRTEHERMLRYGSPYSILLVDLDHFKRINDTHGHPMGDEILRRVARLLRQRARVTDTVARYGGEEFALLLLETTREQATTVAEDACCVVRDGDLPVPVTVSVGLASSSDGFAESAEELLAAADRALYAAKDAGRNQVGVTRPPTPAITYLADDDWALEDPTGAPRRP